MWSIWIVIQLPSHVRHKVGLAVSRDLLLDHVFRREGLDHEGLDVPSLIGGDDAVVDGHLLVHAVQKPGMNDEAIKCNGSALLELVAWIRLMLLSATWQASRYALDLLIAGLCQHRGQVAKFVGVLFPFTHPLKSVKRVFKLRANN